MDVLDFAKISRRICKSHCKDCSECPLFVAGEECYVGGRLYDIDTDISVVEKVEKWVKEHPAKTRQSGFLKLFPNIPIDDNGIVRMTPCSFGFVFKDGEINITTSPYEGCETGSRSCNECRKKFWLEEIEE